MHGKGSLACITAQGEGRPRSGKIHFHKENEAGHGVQLVPDSFPKRCPFLQMSLDESVRTGQHGEHQRAELEEVDDVAQHDSEDLPMDLLQLK